MKTWHKHLDTRSRLFFFLITLKLKTLDTVATEAFSHIPWKTSRKALYRDLFCRNCPSDHS